MAEKKDSFDYKPGPGGKTGKSSKKTLTWTASEYIDHQRGAFWYLMLVLLTIAMAAIMYFLTGDYFAVTTVVIAGVILGSAAHWKPRQLEYELSAAGLRIGEKFYPLSNFKTFAIVQEADLVSLVMNPIKRFMPPISAFVDESDAKKIIDIIGDHLPMVEGGLDRIDRLARRLRF